MLSHTTQATVQANDRYQLAVLLDAYSNISGGGGISFLRRNQEKADKIAYFMLLARVSLVCIRLSRPTLRFRTRDTLVTIRYRFALFSTL